MLNSTSNAIVEFKIVISFDNCKNSPKENGFSSKLNRNISFIFQTF